MFLITFFLFSIDTLNIDLKKAIQIAFENNPDIQIQYKYNTLTRINFLNSVFDYLPSISAEGSYTNAETELPTFIPGVPSPIIISSQKGYTFTFRVNQKIFSPYSLSQIINSYYTKEKSEFNLMDYEMKFVNDIHRAYFNALKIKKLLNVMKKSLERAEDNLKLAEERYNQGIISYYDYLNIKIQKEEALLNYKKVEKDYYNSLFDLKLILGIRNDTLFVPEDININEIKLRKIKEKKLLKYEAEKYSERISKLNFLRDLVSFLPEVYFSYYYSYRDSLFKNLFDEPGRTRGYYLSLSLRFWDYPFNLWKDKTNLDIERQRVKKALIMSEVGIKKAEKEIEVQKSSLKVAKQKLSISELGYQIALESFKLGKISSIELREAEENLTRAEIDYITSLYDYKLSLSYYLYLTGNLEVEKEEE